MTGDDETGREEAERRVGTRTSTGWRIGELLRVNGMGALHEASRGQGDATERSVIHVPSAEVERSLLLRAEFQRGAWASARLSHPRAFVPTDESTTAEGVPCVAWPLPPGKPLAEYIEAGGGMSRDDGLRVLEQVLDVLEHGHATAVLHGAIDPWAVWQTPRRSARLILFAFPPGVRDAGLYDGRGLVALRRDRYQAPELAENLEPPTETSDVYSLAMVVACAMVGPLSARLGRTLAFEKLVVLGLDEPLAAVLALALARSPTDRYASAVAMLKDVRRVIAGEAPRLEASGATGGSFDGVFLNESTSSIVIDLRAREKAAVRARELVSVGTLGKKRSQAGGDALLLAMIVVIVGAATMAIWHERKEEERALEHAPSSSPP